MHLTTLLQMSVDGMGGRIALGTRSGGVPMAEFGARVERVAALLAQRPVERLALVDLNSDAVPTALFAAAVAGKPFVPINYRLADRQLRAVVERAAPALVVAGAGVPERIGEVDGIEYVGREALLERAADPDAPRLETGHREHDPDGIAVLLFTSGTTGEPKAAVLRHRNLVSYVLGSVEFGGAGEDEAAIVSVPPYHVAGVASVLSSTYAGRRVVHVEAFEPREWVATVRRERITHAMVVPTMLNRILDVIDRDGPADGQPGLPSLRSLSYGGGPMPVAVIERALRLLPEVGFVNAYGLTETASTVALLGPDDHVAAFGSVVPAVRARLGSVGMPLPGVEVSIRDAGGEPVPTGERGEIWVRGDQVSGEYLGRDERVDDGWFRTRDAGHLDQDGYLFVHGRLDDLIVRGGENLSPGEIESVLLEHPAVADAAVVGLPDIEWGEKVVAAVVAVPGTAADEAELREFVKARLRSTRTPERIDVRADLPYNETGKLLRRVLRSELARAFASEVPA